MHEPGGFSDLSGALGTHALTIDQIRPCKREPRLDNVLELSLPTHIILQGKHKAGGGASQRGLFAVRLSLECLNNQMRCWPSAASLPTASTSLW